MTKYVFQQSAFSADEAVSVAPYASFTFTDAATGAAADLWEDDAGLVPITGNVVLADEYGYVRAYLTAGFYDVAIVAGSLTKTLVDVSIGIAAVESVNGQTGIVVLGASDVGADPAGTGATEAASAVSAHSGATDPHGDRAYADSLVGGATAFVVGTWNMTGATTTAEPVSTLAGTVGGTAPNFELTPTAPLAGSVPGSFMALAASSAGVPKTGTGQLFAKVTLPVADPGDNLVGVTFFICNSSATELDIATLTNGGTPTNAIWGVGSLATTAVFGGVSSSVPYVNNIEGTIVGDSTGWVSSDIAYFGYDYDTGNVIVQKNSGTVIQLAPLDLTGCPPGDTLKVMMGAVFLSATPTLLDAPIVFSLGTTDGGKTPFTALGDATLPIGAADGLVYEVTVAGRFGGKQAGVGDYVQLYDTTTKIIVTANQDTVATAVADLSLLDGRVTTLETTVSQQKVNDTLSVRTVSAPGTTTLGVTPNAGFIRVSVGAASESFNIVAATGKVARVVVEVEKDLGYPGSLGDIYTINGANFDATTNGLVLEVFDDEAGFNTWMRMLKSPGGGVVPYNVINLADAVLSNDIDYCSYATCTLENLALTGALATWGPLGAQFDHLVQLHDVVKFSLAASTAFGITNLDGQGWGLAPGESAIRYRNGIWLKV